MQITRAYYTNGKGEEKVLTRNEYTIIEPKQRTQKPSGDSSHLLIRLAQRQRARLWSKDQESAAKSSRCAPILSAKSMASPTIAPSRRAAEREREREWKRQQEERAKHRGDNRRLLDAVLERSAENSDAG